MNQLQVCTSRRIISFVTGGRIRRDFAKSIEGASLRKIHRVPSVCGGASMSAKGLQAPVPCAAIDTAHTAASKKIEGAASAATQYLRGCFTSRLQAEERMVFVDTEKQRTAVIDGPAAGTCVPEQANARFGNIRETLCAHPQVYLWFSRDVLPSLAAAAALFAPWGPAK